MNKTNCLAYIAVAAAGILSPVAAFSQINTVKIVTPDCNSTPKDCTRRVGYVDPNNPNPKHPTGVKFSSPSCPSGYKVVGGGHRIVDWGSADANTIHVWWSFPEPSLNGWAVHVRNTDPNAPTPASLIKVEVSATCVGTRANNHPQSLLTELDIPIPPNPYQGNNPVQARFVIGKNYINEANLFMDYARNLCAQSGYTNNLPRVFYSPQIGLHSFSIDAANRRFLSQEGTNNVLIKHPTVKEAQITHIRCMP